MLPLLPLKPPGSSLNSSSEPGSGQQGTCAARSWSVLSVLRHREHQALASEVSLSIGEFPGMTVMKL